MSLDHDVLPARTMEGEARAIAVEAYVYLFPLVLMEVTRRQMTPGPVGTKVGFAPMGAFSHAREFPPGDFKGVVRPNFDTLYSGAWLDVEAEPSIVSVPDTHGRYYLLPMYDMWTEAFAVPGKRTTGTTAASYAVVPPGWRGELPAGVRAVHAATPHIWGHRSHVRRALIRRVPRSGRLGDPEVGATPAPLAPQRRRRLPRRLAAWSGCRRSPWPASWLWVGRLHVARHRGAAR